LAHFNWQYQPSDFRGLALHNKGTWRKIILMPGSALDFFLQIISKTYKLPRSTSKAIFPNFPDSVEEIQAFANHF
jgi:hypothetical protein